MTQKCPKTVLRYTRSTNAERKSIPLILFSFFKGEFECLWWCTKIMYCPCLLRFNIEPENTCHQGSTDKNQSILGPTYLVRSARTQLISIFRTRTGSEPRKIVENWTDSDRPCIPACHICAIRMQHHWIILSVIILNF